MGRPAFALEDGYRKKEMKRRYYNGDEDMKVWVML